MKRPTLTKAIAAAGACAVVGAGAGIVGSAAAPSSKSPRSPQGPPGFFFKRHGLRHGPPGFGFGGPPVHSEAVVPNKAGNGFVTATMDNGKVKSVSGNDVVIDEGTPTLHYKDVTVTIPSGATVYRNGSKSSVGALKQGDEVHVTSSSDGTFVGAEDASHEGWRHGGMPAGPPPPALRGGAPGGPPGPYGGWR